MKVSRSDWQSELQDPAKSDAFIPFCDRWFVVAAPKVVRLEELRASWGLMELTKGGALRIRRQAEKNAAQLPLPKNMMAAWMRRTAEGATDGALRQAREAGARERDRYHEERKRRQRRTGAECELEDLKRTVDEFERASGVSIKRWDAGRVGEAVAMIRNLSPSELGGQVKYLSQQLSAISARVDEVSG